MDEYVTIHGDKWKWADIQESVEWARNQQWKKQKWVARAALVSKGSTSDYVGQKYNPEHTKLVEDGWTHDHCEICWWSIHETEEPEHGVGYTTNGHKWVCTECYTHFIEKMA
jgi:hypothetical protein